MKLEDLQVGDRVAYKYNTSFKGVVGIIDKRCYLPVGVIHDDYNKDRHSLGGLCEWGYGLWYSAVDLILLENQEISDFSESDKPLSFLFE